jgi:hypothetical protein
MKLSKRIFLVLVSLSYAVDCIAAVSKPVCVKWTWTGDVHARKVICLKWKA